MSVRKKPSSAADTLRQELQQPLVIPNPTPNNLTAMTPSTNDSAANEAKLQKQIADLQAQLEAQATSSKQLQTKADGLTKELKDAKETVVKLAGQGKAPAKPTAIATTDKTRASLTSRPTLSREETAIRRANTDIGWLD